MLTLPPHIRQRQEQSQKAIDEMNARVGYKVFKSLTNTTGLKGQKE